MLTSRRRSCVTGLTKLEVCMIPAAQNTMLQAYKRDGVHSHKHQPGFDSSCREILGLKEAVYKKTE